MQKSGVRKKVIRKIRSNYELLYRNLLCLAEWLVAKN